jgi:hypothetical protein
MAVAHTLDEHDSAQRHPWIRSARRTSGGNG